MPPEPALKGYLVVNVHNVTGRTKEEEPVWDSFLNDAFVKIEVRGGPRTVKKETTSQPVADSLISFEEQLALEILEGAKELRIMLCRQRQNSGGKPGTCVVAACGIYVQDILDAVPIDKFFDLFKPGVGAEGGFVRVSMSFVPPEQVGRGSGLLPEEGGSQGAEQNAQRRRVLVVLKAGLVLGVAAVAGYIIAKGKGPRRQREDGAQQATGAVAKRK